MEVLWILLCCLMPVHCIHTGEFCKVRLNFLRVTSCEDDHGPVLNCDYPYVVKHLNYIKRVQDIYKSQIGHLGPSTKYEDFKLLKAELRAFLNATENFYRFLKQQQAQNTNTSGEECVNMNHFRSFLAQLRNRDSTAGFEYWIDYYFPVIAGLELIFGMLGNIMIVTIFVRHKDMRTGPNKVILNLAIGDMLLLVTNIVVFYGRYRWLPTTLTSTVCYVMSYTRTAGIASSVYSMVMLSILRFLVTAAVPGSRIQSFMNRYVKISVLLVLVWILAGLTGIFDAYNAMENCEFAKGTLKQYLKFMCICLLPFATIGAFSVATSRIIRKSVQRVPGEQTSGVARGIRARKRGARVILSLVVVFCVTYLPLNIYFLVGKDSGATDHLYVFTAQLLIPLSSCLNPVALCVGSGNFRKHFKNYLLKCRFWNSAG